MKLTICILMLFIILFVGCDNSPLESESSTIDSEPYIGEFSVPSESENESSAVGSDIPEEIEYDFEKGETSVDLARQLKPLMTAHLARITLRSSPDNRVSSIKREHQYILIEGGYVRYSFVAASELIAEMKDKEHVNVLVSAYIQNVDGTKEVLFDISDSEGLCADDIIYGPMVSLDKVAKLEENMTKNEVVALLGDFHVSEEERSGYYDLEDGRLLYLEYSADTDENLVLVYAKITSAIGGWENFKTEVLFDMRVSP